MIPKPGARVRIRYGRPFEVAPATTGWRRDWRRPDGRLAEIAGTSRMSAAGRHPPGDALALDQPAAGRAAGAAGAAAGLRPLARRHGRRGAWPTGAAGSPVRDLPLPSVAVGNLTVGGSGKTPIAIWIARHYVARGLRPGHPAPRLRRRRDPGAPARGARGAWWWPIPTGPPAPSARWPTARRCWCWTMPTSGSTSAATSTSWW